MANRRKTRPHGSKTRETKGRPGMEVPLDVYEHQGMDDPIRHEDPERPRKGDAWPPVQETCGEHECHNITLGAQGEEVAAMFLEQSGFHIVDRNWRCHVGEVDIVALESGTLHFIEVKTRMSALRGFPEEAVDRRKRQTYEVIAESYLYGNRISGNMAITFDVIAILVQPQAGAMLKFHQNVLAWE